MKNIKALITAFKGRLNNKGTYTPIDPKILAEQRLALRCACFKSTAEIKAYLEALGCRYPEYLDIKRRYRLSMIQFKKLSKPERRELLITANIDPKIALYEKLYE